MNLLLEAIVWSIGVTIVAQAVSIGLLWLLGLHPKNLIREIEEVQNTAVGAVFFVVSLIAAFFISVLAADFSVEGPGTDSLPWIIVGVLLATIYTIVVYYIAHWVMKPESGENVYRYLRREIIAEQNAALALFYGGLTVAPFIAVLFQII